MNIRMVLGALTVIVCAGSIVYWCQKSKESGMACFCCGSHDKKEVKELVTASGLRHLVLVEASSNARQAKAGDVVKVHYSGWLSENGQKGALFDSSLKRGTPFTFELGARNVIAGWDEGVALMKEGETRRLIIPGNLAYGEQGFPGVIPPNATLIFDVELLEIIPA